MVVGSSLRRGGARGLGRFDLRKFAIGFGHFACQPFAECSGGSGFLRALGADDVIAVGLADIDGEGAQEPAVDDRIRAQDLIAQSEALARFGCLDGKVILKGRSAPALCGSHPGGGEPVVPPFLALFMEEIIVGKVFGLQIFPAGDELRRANGKNLDVGELLSLDVQPIARARILCRDPPRRCGSRPDDSAGRRRALCRGAAR